MPKWMHGGLEAVRDHLPTWVPVAWIPPPSAAPLDRGGLPLDGAPPVAADGGSDTSGGGSEGGRGKKKYEFEKVDSPNGDGLESSTKHGGFSYEGSDAPGHVHEARGSYQYDHNHDYRYVDHDASYQYDATAKAKESTEMDAYSYELKQTESSADDKAAAGKGEENGASAGKEEGGGAGSGKEGRAGQSGGEQAGAGGRADGAGAGAGTGAGTGASAGGHSQLGTMAAAVSAGATLGASTGWVRKRVRPEEYKQSLAKEAARRAQFLEGGAVSASAQAAAAKALSQKLKHAKWVKSMGSLRSGQGGGEGQGVGVGVKAQARAELLMAIQGAKDAHLPDEVIEAAQAALDDAPQAPAMAPPATRGKETEMV